MEHFKGSKKYKGRRDDKYTINSINYDGSPILPCEILGIKSRFLIDSGSRVTLANADLWESIKDKLLENEDCREICQLPTLVSVTGEPLRISKGYEVPINIGKYKVVVPILFCQLSPRGLDGHGILGNDVLQSLRIDLLAGQSIRFQDQIIPLENCNDENIKDCNRVGIKDSPSSTNQRYNAIKYANNNKDVPIKVTNYQKAVPRIINKRSNISKRISKEITESFNGSITHRNKLDGSNVKNTAHPVYTSRPVYLQARSERHVHVKVNHPIKINTSLGEIAYVSPINLGLPGVMIAHSATSANQKNIYVRVINTTAQDVHIPKHKLVGVMEKAYETQNNESQEHQSKITDLNERTKLILEGINIDLETLSPEQQEHFISLIKKYHSIFYLPGDNLGCCNLVEHHIKLKKDAKPVNQRPYPVPYALRPELDRHINEMLEQGIIRKCISPWNSRIFLIKKKGGAGTRFICDLREVNKSIVEDTFVLPKIDEMLYSMGPSQYFSNMDLAHGFHQIRLHKDSQPITAFSTNRQKYAYCRIPMGLSSSPSCFQRLGNFIFEGLAPENIFIYLDDLLIASSTIEDHMNKIEMVFQRLKEVNLKLKPQKCNFIKPELEHLGHVLSAEGVKPMEDKVKAIKLYPQPKNVKELRRLLGLASYYRKFCPKFAEITEPLTYLTKKNVPYVWTEKQEKAFQTLKEKLASAPILAQPIYGRPFIVSTDASKYAIAGCLSQVDEKGNEHPVSYISRKLKDSEVNYSTVEKEALALIYCVKTWHIYLYGNTFIAKVDQMALKWILSLKNPNSRLARWCLILMDYKFIVTHVKGKDHNVPDALSRILIEDGTIKPVTEELEEMWNKSDPQYSVNAIQEKVPDYIPYLDKEMFREAQQNDPETLELLTKDPEHFDTREGLICKVRDEKYSSHLRSNYIVVVPRKLRTDILKSFHAPPYCGHLAADKTYGRIINHYYWKGLSNDVKLFCKSCEKCQGRKNTTYQGPAPLQSLPDVERPFQRISIDLITRLPTTKNGNKNILVIIDAFSKFVEAVPLPDQTSKTVGKALVNFILTHSVPEQILSDLGGCFVSKMMKTLYKALGVKKLQTTPFHPMCNGQVENLNSTLYNILALIIDKEHTSWDEFLKFSTFSYNTAIHRSTKETPFYLAYGRDPVLPVDGILDKSSMQNNSEYVLDLPDYTAQVTERMEKAFAYTKENIDKAHKYQKSYYDRKAKNVQLRPGMKVLMHQIPITTPNKTSRKLNANRWVGPFRILERLSETVFKIKPINGYRTQNVNSNRLKPFLEYRVYDSDPHSTPGGKCDNPDCPKCQNNDEEPYIGTYNEGFVRTLPPLQPRGTSEPPNGDNPAPAEADEPTDVDEETNSEPTAEEEPAVPDEEPADTSEPTESVGNQFPTNNEPISDADDQDNVEEQPRRTPPVPARTPKPRAQSDISGTVPKSRRDTGTENVSDNTRLQQARRAQANAGTPEHGYNLRKRTREVKPKSPRDRLASLFHHKKKDAVSTIQIPENLETTFTAAIMNKLLNQLSDRISITLD